MSSEIFTSVTRNKNQNKRTEILQKDLAGKHDDVAVPTPALAQIRLTCLRLVAAAVKKTRNQLTRIGDAVRRVSGV
ncbi:hypothetical protein M405DRAFT_866833 [Rhizopogon salebrosus TDB-379]|nr:hypothetical protein M405DRAFT_866833 [Rhizopogon salebrosus TDB-379]